MLQQRTNASARDPDSADKLIARLTIVSREAKKKRSNATTVGSYLHVAPSSNALAKPPLKLSLSYYRPTTFLLYRINKPRMEEIGATIPKYQPLRDLWRPLCDYARRQGRSQTSPDAQAHKFL